MSLQRILYVASEIAPFLETSLVSNCVRKLPEAMQNRQMDVRIIVPKFGIINDRMNRLHEVLRLSGTIVSIHEVQYAISVKVSTIPNTRLQVYFIGNDDLFGNRKAVFKDAYNNFFEDNDLRMIFFCTAVMESLKKLEWEADIVHCHDWITSLIPLFWKKLYKNHPLFTKAKLISTIYNNTFSHHFPFLAEKVAKIGVANEDTAFLASGSFRNIIQLAMHYSDIVVRGEKLDATEFKDLFTGQDLPLVENDDLYNEHHFKMYAHLMCPDLTF
ncbi:glycogen/starch synthase [Candidatus Cardinium hertigii]|jgi:starch synthase|uniref:starch synthase n=1 Tax=Candidatus Cardinium hertigii TaxID=247481 RepID=A0A3N2QCZ7_9BACT|nr:glycogen/starch synthase [Candidatus Cardinium hertigii]ROT47690.1 glycogen synthase [Candidatus Cardinium hertigii]ROT47696.1 glycogen synthase [Candidatus Cardinium hertigii]